MSLKNASVALSYQLPGSLKSPGQYDYQERTSKGNIIDDKQRLFVKEAPLYNDCHQVVNLCESFVNHAISVESRPRRNQSFRAFTFWNRMTEEERLKWHIARYVSDMNATEYKFEILMS
jgi:hypothetical protein